MINYLALLVFLGMVEVYAGPEFLGGLAIGIYIGIEVMNWRWQRGERWRGQL